MPDKDPVTTLPGGYSTLAGGLFSSAYNFQVTSRRRLKAIATVSVPASGSATVSLQTPFTPDTMTVRDGAQFDLLLVIGTAGASGLTMSALSYTVDAGQGGVVVPGTGFVLPNQPIFTNAVISSVANFLAVLTPSPTLLTYTDLENLGVNLTDLTGPIQLRGDVQAVVANSTAGAINVTLTAIAWIRFVRGLQEG